ncbi:MAG: tetratricopeptide repeat protein [Rhodothermales bacterium]
MTTEVTNFQQEVLEKSYTTPVLVDFWAPWCGPCRTLGPVLEKLARENDKAWMLAKVNTDEHPELSMEYGIRGIPAVKLFVEGQVVNEFTGALPEFTVRKWLDEALPSETKKHLAQAEAALNTNRSDIAERLLRQVLAEEPDHPKARMLLAQLLAFNDPAEASALAQGAVTERGFVQIQQAIETVAHLKHLKDHPDDLPDEDGKALYLTALEALLRRDFDTALTHLIEILQKNRYYDDDGARKAGIAIFTLLGPDHSVTRKHRRTFDMWLY